MVHFAILTKKGWKEELFPVLVKKKCHMSLTAHTYIHTHIYIHTYTYIHIFPSSFLPLQCEFGGINILNNYLSDHIVGGQKDTEKNLSSI